MTPEYLKKLPDAQDFQTGTPGWIMADQMHNNTHAIQHRLNEINKQLKEACDSHYAMRMSENISDASERARDMQTDIEMVQRDLIEIQIFTSALEEQKVQWDSLGQFTKDREI